jgi:hypothetical protein
LQLLFEINYLGDAQKTGNLNESQRIRRVRAFASGPTHKLTHRIGGSFAQAAGTAHPVPGLRPQRRWWSARQLANYAAMSGPPISPPATGVAAIESALATMPATTRNARTCRAHASDQVFIRHEML